MISTIKSFFTRLGGWIKSAGSAIATAYMTVGTAIATAARRGTAIGRTTARVALMSLYVVLIAGVAGLAIYFGGPLAKSSVSWAFNSLSSVYAELTTPKETNVVPPKGDTKQPATAGINKQELEAALVAAMKVLDGKLKAEFGTVKTELNSLDQKVTDVTSKQAASVQNAVEAATAPLKTQVEALAAQLNELKSKQTPAPQVKDQYYDDWSKWANATPSDKHGFMIHHCASGGDWVVEGFSDKEIQDHLSTVSAKDAEQFVKNGCKLESIGLVRVAEVIPPAQKKLEVPSQTQQVQYRVLNAGEDRQLLHLLDRKAQQVLGQRPNQNYFYRPDVGRDHALPVGCRKGKERFDPVTKRMFGRVNCHGVRPNRL